MESLMHGQLLQDPEREQNQIKMQTTLTVAKIWVWSLARHYGCRCNKNDMLSELICPCFSYVQQDLSAFAIRPNSTFGGAKNI
jgi:hypothetical protein